MISFKKIPNDETDLIEIQVSDSNNPYIYLPAWWARDVNSYYCDGLGIEHCDSYEELKKTIINKLS